MVKFFLKQDKKFKIHETRVIYWTTFFKKIKLWYGIYADSVGPVLCALPRSEQLRRPGAWQEHSPWVGGCILSLPPSQLQWVPQLGAAVGVPSQVCCVSPLGS